MTAMLAIALHVGMLFQVTHVSALRMLYENKDTRTIPERVVGNYYVDITKPAETLSRHDQGIKKNINHTLTVNKFDSDRLEWALDKDCEEMLERVHSEALRHAFVKEKHGPYKSDICRLAQLAEKGGWYMDNDMVANLDLHEYIPADASFVTAIDAMQSGELFNSLLGVAPKHPIIFQALNMTLQHYQTKQPTFFKDRESLKPFTYNGLFFQDNWHGKDETIQLSEQDIKWHLGPLYLGRAYNWWAGISGKHQVAGEVYHADRPDGFQHSYLLQETKLGQYQWGVLDPKYDMKNYRTQKVIFYSHENKLRH